MVNTVAITPGTGLLGSELVSVLIPLHDAGKIKLIVVHRPSSKTGHVPAQIEKRVLDYDNITPDAVAKGFAGVDVLVSTVKWADPTNDEKFIEALDKLPPGQLKAYIPSDFTLNTPKEEEEDPKNDIVYHKAQLNNKARALGIPVAVIHNGTFAPHLFDVEFLGLDAKKNTLYLYGDSLNRTFPVTTVPYLAGAIAQLVQLPPAELAGSVHTVVDLEPTGNEIVAALTKAHGKPTKIVPFTDDEAAKKAATGPGGYLGALIQKRWGAAEFSDEGRFRPTGVAPGKLEDVVEFGINRTGGH